MGEHQGTRLSALRERVARGEYQVDSRAVAEAIVRRRGRWALEGPPGVVFGDTGDTLSAYEHSL